MAWRTVAEEEASKGLVFLEVNPVVRFMALPLLAAAVSIAIPAVLGFAAGDTLYAERFTAWSVLYAGAAALWFLVTRPRGSVGKDGALVLVAASWVLTPLLSAVPVAVEMGIPFVDAWFESVSGYTTTGLSVFSGGVDRDYGVYLPAVEELPATVLWWRAVIQWLGGFGVVVFFYTVARIGRLPAHLVGAAEGRFERLEPSIARSLRALMGLYIFLTLAGTSLLYLAGMSPGDALYHTMTGLATGGFSTHSSSIGYYNNVLVEAATITVMLLGAFNFADMYAFLRGVPRRYSGEIPVFLALVSLEVAVAALLLAHQGWPASLHPLREAAFDVVSAATGTGFGISDLSKAPDAYKVFLAAVMLVGGSAFSTTGGIKIFRFIVVLRSIVWSIRETVYGAARISVKKIGNYTVDESTLQNALAVFFLFLLSWFTGAMLLMALLGASAADALFEAQSALCAVGLSVGITSASTPLAAKLVLIILMTIGRLEIIGFMYAAAALYRMLASRPHPRRTAKPARLAVRTGYGLA